MRDFVGIGQGQIPVVSNIRGNWVLTLVLLDEWGWNISSAP